MMQSVVFLTVVASGSRISDMSKYFRDSRRESYDPATLAWFVSGVVLAAGVVAFCYWWNTRPRKKYHSHDKLLVSLCRLHGIDRRDRELLNQWAESAGIEWPSRWFTEPSLLRSYKRQADESAIADIERLQSIMFRSTSR
ncbi:MAG: hypothetical protein R3C05_08180 [Pirellulaceae bacterium]